MSDFFGTVMQVRLFLSYSRDDDEPFVHRLYDDLIRAGFDVWFDRVSMPSRQLTFYQEIRDAIAERDRLVLIVGPKAMVSAYVDQEWRFAFEVGKCVNPIIRLPLVPPGVYADIATVKDAQQKAYELVPEELKLIHAEDFRDDDRYAEHLANLVRQLSDPTPPLGKLIAVPGLPVHYRAQPDRLRSLRDALLIDLQKPVVVTGAASKVGVEGMAGIGKSVLAAALARDPEVRRAFPDGIFWVGIGQVPTEENAQQQRLAELQRNVARELGHDALFNNPVVGKQVLRELLADGKKAVLILLDDVWQRAAADAFDVVGPRSRLLLTTRDAGLVTALTGTGYQVQLPTEAEALALLASNSGLTVGDLPPQAEQIVIECGRLPLALALCGGMVRNGTPWYDLLEALRELDLEFLADEYPAESQHQNIARALELSIQMLPENKRRRFAELAVFSEDAEVPEAAVQTLWSQTGGLSERHSRQLLLEFKQRSIAQYQTDNNAAKVSMHDLMHDLATRMAIHFYGSYAALHQQLLNAYRKKMPDGWYTGLDDGYLYNNLCEHLIAATCNVDEVVDLLCDLRFIEARCREDQVFELIADYHLAKENLPEVQEELRKERARQERSQRWTTELIEYSRQWSDRYDRAARREIVDESKPLLPRPPETCRIWTEEEIEIECQRIIERPTRFDTLEVFRHFVESECYSLLEFGGLPTFVAQHAFANAPSGSVHESAKALLSTVTTPYILTHWSPDALYNPKPACLRTLEGHAGWVHSVSMTCDGRLAVTGSDDNTLLIWDLESGACLRRLLGHNSVVLGLSITPDGKRAVSGGDSHTLDVWDLESGTLIWALEGHTALICSVSIKPDGRHAVSGSSDKTLRLWDLQSGTCLKALKGHSDAVSCVDITPDGRYIASGGDDGILCIWNSESGTCLCKLEGHTEAILSLGITPHGERLVSTSRDDTLRIWNTENGVCIRTLEVKGGDVASVSITPDGHRAVTGSGNGTICIWDLESGACLRILESFGGDGRGANITSDGQLAVMECQRNLKVWNLQSGLSMQVKENRSGSWPSTINITPDGKKALTKINSKTLNIWELENCKCLNTLLNNQVGFDGVSILPNGRRVLLGCGREIQEWDIETGEYLRTVANISADRLTVTPDGRRVVLAGTGLRILDIENGFRLRTLAEYSIEASIGTLIVAPNGQHVLSGTGDFFGLWDLGNGKCIRVFRAASDINPSNDLCNASITPDGRYMVSATNHYDILLWDMTTGACIRTLEGHRGFIFSLTITSDGLHLLSGGADKTIRIWDLENGDCIKVFRTNSEIHSLGIFSQQIVIGLETGEVLFAEMQNFRSGPAIVTAISSEKARCPLCGHEFKPTSTVNTAINTASTANLFSHCPNCLRALKFNSFFSAEDDYTELLRRSLHQLTHAKYAYLDEIIAHLSALISQLEKIDKHAEADLYKEDRDRLSSLYQSTRISRLSEESKMRTLALKLSNEELKHDKSHPLVTVRINNLCIELIIHGRLEEAKLYLDKAWLLKSGQHDFGCGQTLILFIAVAFLEENETGGYLGKLKALFVEDTLPNRDLVEYQSLDVNTFNEYLQINLSPDQFEFLVKLEDALYDTGEITELENYDIWQKVAPADLD